MRDNNKIKLAWGVLLPNCKSKTDEKWHQQRYKQETMKKRVELGRGPNFRCICCRRDSWTRRSKSRSFSANTEKAQKPTGATIERTDGRLERTSMEVLSHRNTLRDIGLQSQSITTLVSSLSSLILFVKAFTSVLEYSLTASLLAPSPLTSLLSFKESK